MEPISISYSRALQVMDHLHQSGVRLLIFEGGEPLLWKDGDHAFEDLVSYAREKFFRVGVTTNGTLPLKSKADIIWVSIDGLQEQHDKNRGKSFNTIIQNIQKSMHPRIYANITITSLNHSNLTELIHFLSKIVKGITIQFYYPFPNSENLALSEENRQKALDTLIRLKKKGLPILDSYSALQKLKTNSWKCHDWLIANAEPNGAINYGCYLKNRAPIACEQCGFAAHTEISLAHDFYPDAIFTGIRTFDMKIVEKI